jgi:hypothetical protein
MSLKPITGRKLWFWMSGGDVVMRPDHGRPLPIPESELADLRRHFRCLARAARNAGDKAANRLWTSKWRDLGDAMAALEHHKLVCGRGLREQLQASLNTLQTGEH